jgi:hypothetical protein
MTDNPMSSAHQKCRRTAIKRSGQEGDCGIAWSATVTPPRIAPRGGIEPPLPGPREPTIYGPLGNQLAGFKGNRVRKARTKRASALEETIPSGEKPR